VQSGSIYLKLRITEQKTRLLSHCYSFLYTQQKHKCAKPGDLPAKVIFFVILGVQKATLLISTINRYIEINDPNPYYVMSLIHTQK
jgi:hypothetical protein